MKWLCIAEWAQSHLSLSLSSIERGHYLAAAILAQHDPYDKFSITTDSYENITGCHPHDEDPLITSGLISIDDGGRVLVRGAYTEDEY